MRVGDVILTADTWVSGARAQGWYGPVDFELPVRGQCWEEAIDTVLETAAAQCRALGGNAVCKVEIHVSPFAVRNGEPCPTIGIKGTIANLEPLFRGLRRQRGVPMSERYRGHIIERHHTGPWLTTYEWRCQNYSDPHDPLGYEPSVAKCKEAIDDLIADRCTPCGGTGEMKVDPFEADLMPCPHCSVIE